MPFVPSSVPLRAMAGKFLDQFFADLDKFSLGNIPQSQTVQIASRLRFDFTNSGTKAIYLIPYAGGTIASDDQGDGLEPRIVDDLEQMCELHGVNYQELITTFPNSEFVWVKIPPEPLDSGTMEEPERTSVVRFIGQQAQLVIAKHGRLDGIFFLHGTDTEIITLSRIAEAFSCTSVPIIGCSAQDRPGIFSGDGPNNIRDGILLLHSGITGHFAICQKMITTPFDSSKITDHGHGIFRQGPYGYGHYGTMDSSGIDVVKNLVRMRSQDDRFMPYDNPALMAHYEAVSGSYSKDYATVKDGLCHVVDINALPGQIAHEIHRIKKGEAGYHYAILSAYGSSNTSSIRKDLLRAASEKGVCSIVVSEVPGASEVSPYKAGVRNTEHVTVAQPTTMYHHTLSMFYFSAALTEYIMDIYKIGEGDKEDIRPVLFREVYNRSRGYAKTFIPNARPGKIEDYALQLWCRAKMPATPRPS